jgi:hypothetical protein
MLDNVPSLANPRQAGSLSEMLDNVPSLANPRQAGSLSDNHNLVDDISFRKQLEANPKARISFKH